MAQIAYDDEKYKKGIDTSYYTNAIENYKKQQEQNRANQIADAQTTQQSAFRQAYIQKMQNDRALEKALATQGIRGGASETARLGVQNQYGQARAAAASDYADAVKGINQNIDSNIQQYQSDMDSRAEEYKQNLAQARWQAEREDATNEQNRLADYYSNLYLNYYSGASKKTVQNAVKSIEKALKTATGNEKIRLQQQLSGAKARLGVIANK